MGAPRGNKNAAGRHQRRTTYMGKGGRLLRSSTHRNQLKVIKAYTRKMERLHGRGH